jgi:flagellar biosynthesis chaperone FliJ
VPPLPQDVAGELGKYVDTLKRSLETVRQDLGVVRAQIRLENVEAQLLTGLSAEEQSALQPFLQQLNLAELQSRRDLLLVEQSALVKAIGLLEARLNG